MQKHCRTLLLLVAVVPAACSSPTAGDTAPPTPAEAPGQTAAVTATAPERERCPRALAGRILTVDPILPVGAPAA